eukprot:jgi/Chrpa1/12422/Chrysochromulina_OHIO_Genome00000032-RA
MSTNEDKDVEVRREDQDCINQFGRLNGRMHDIEDELKAAQSKYELLDDASNEIILADDDVPVRYLFGECFFELSKDSTDEMLEKQKSEVQEQIDSHKAELLTIRETLADLKGKLYGRFGKNINLEE